MRHPMKVMMALTIKPHSCGHVIIMLFLGVSISIAVPSFDNLMHIKFTIFLILFQSLPFLWQANTFALAVVTIPCYKKANTTIVTSAFGKMTLNKMLTLGDLAVTHIPFFKPV